MIVSNPKVLTTQASSKVFVDRDKLELDEREQAHDEATKDVVIPQQIDPKIMEQLQEMAKNTLERLALEKKQISRKSTPSLEISNFKKKSESLKYYKRGILQAA